MKKNTTFLSRRFLSLIVTAAMTLSLCAPAAARLESIHILETESVTQEVSAESSVAQTFEEEVPVAEDSEEETPVSLESGALESASLENYSGGSGTESDPYLISSLADLEALRDASVADGDTGTFGSGTYYKLTADIAAPLTGYGLGYFAGSFDGGGHTVALELDTGVKLMSGYTYLGLFGCLSTGATVKNLNLTGTVTLTNNVSGATYVGALSGWAFGDSSNRTKIYNIGSTVNVTGYAATFGHYVGGLFGSTSYLNLANSWSTGTVTTGYYVGGLVGNASSSKFSNSWFGGSVGSGSNYGAIVGYASGAYSDNVYAQSGSRDGLTPDSSLTTAGFYGASVSATYINNCAVYEESDMKSATFAARLNEGRNVAAGENGIDGAEDIAYWKTPSAGSYPAISATAPTAPTVTVNGTAAFGNTLTASSTASGTTTWQWQSATTSDGTYSDISGANTASYTITEDDTGHYIRARALSYGEETACVYSEPKATLLAAPTGLSVTADPDDVSKAIVTFTPAADDTDYTVEWKIGSNEAVTKTVTQALTAGTEVTYTGMTDLIVGTEYTVTVHTTSSATATATYTPKFGGSGTASDPYLIGGLNDLIALRDASVANGTSAFGSGKVYKLTADITTPLTGSGMRYFAGSFDGGGHTINLNITTAQMSTTGKYYIGLFGGVRSGTVLKNLTLTGAVTATNVTGNDGIFAGALAGIATGGKIYNVGSTAAVTGIALTKTGSYTNFVGGLVGRINNEAKLANSWSIGSVQTGAQVGGLVGNLIDNAVVANCWYAGTASGGSKYNGALVADNQSTVSNSYAKTGSASVLFGRGSGTNCSFKTEAEMKSAAFAALLNEGRSVAAGENGISGAEDIAYWWYNGTDYPYLLPFPNQTPPSQTTISGLQINSAAAEGPYQWADLTFTATAGASTAQGGRYSLKCTTGENKDKYWNGETLVTSETTVWNDFAFDEGADVSLDLTGATAIPDGTYDFEMYVKDAHGDEKPTAAENASVTATFALDNTKPVVASVAPTTDVNTADTITLTLTEVNPKTSGTILGATLTPADGGAAGSLGTVQYTSEGKITAAFSGLSNGKSYKLTIPAAQIQDLAGNTAAAAYECTFTTIDGVDSGAEQGTKALGEVQYGNTFSLALTLKNNNTAITWPANTVSYEMVGEVATVDAGEGKTQYTATYRMLAADGGQLTLTATQEMDTGVTPPWLGFSYEYTVTPTPRVVALSGSTATDRAYDGTTAIAITGTAISNRYGSDDVSLTGALAGTASSAAAGLQTVSTAVGTLALSGAAADKYTLTGTTYPNDLTVTISPKTIDVSTAAISGVTATKEYDGTMTNATVTMTGAIIATGVNGEVLTLTGPTTVNYTDNANVASNHTYQILATSLGIEDKGGALAGNYTLTGTKTFSNGVITKKTITIAPTNVNSQDYPYAIVQGQPAVAISSLTGAWIAPDAPTTLTLGVDFTVTYSLTKGQGVASLSESSTKIAATGAETGITVTATIALTGSAAGNYALTEDTKVLYIDAINGVQIPFNVTQIHKVTYGAEPITISTVLGQKEPLWEKEPSTALKEFTYAIGSNSDGAISLNSNTVTILKAGTATVIVTAKAKTGADTVYAYGAVPYVDNSKTVTITVNKADLTSALQGLTFTKTYDRSANFTNATPNNSTTITGVKSDTFTVSAVNGAYQTSANADTANVADATKVQITGLSLAPVGSAALANYKIGTKDAAATMSELNITTTAPSTISKKAISLSTSLTKAYDGNTNTTLDEVQTKEFNTAPVISGDTITITGVNGAYTSKNIHTAASNSAITFTTSGAENYTITWTVTDEVTHKSGVTVTAKTGDIKIEAAALTTALTSVDSYVNVTGLISDETVANNLYGALTWDDESKSYKSGDGNMSIAFYKLKAGVTSNGGTAGTWADFNKDAETPAENMGDVLELISGTTAPTAGTYYVLINAPTGVVGNYNVTGFADKNSALLASFNKLIVSNPSGTSKPEKKTETLPAAENDVTVEATVKEETASLKLSTAELAKVSGSLTLDLSVLDKPITAAAIPVDTLAKLAGKVDAVTIALTDTVVTLDAAVLDTVADAGSGNVTLSVTEYDKTPLDVGAQIMIGNQPVYELSLKVGKKDIHELGGKATISLPYTLKASEKPELMAVWRIVDGVPQPLECRYDAATGKVIFESETFSLYVVAYFPFVDVPTSSWYYAPAAYTYMTGLMNGMGDYRFQPDFKFSRPMLATMLYGMEGKPAVSMSNPFNDVADDAWYKTPVLWAAEQKLINGYYSNIFGAKDAVTREQMALILYNYATQKGYDVSGSADLTAVIDSQNITGWAQDAMRWAVANGLISGRGDGTLDPKGQISRAEVATIMYAFTQKFVH